MTHSQATVRRNVPPRIDVATVTPIRGGQTLPTTPQGASVVRNGTPPAGSDAPAEENIQRNRRQKEWIGREAAKHCSAKEAVMIDGGSTTLQMCAHLAGLNLQVLTNSLLILNALLAQKGTRVLMPAGQVFPEQNVILSADIDDDMPRFHAPKLFMGAAAITAEGLVQADFILVAAKRRLIDRAEHVVVLADSSKFDGSSGQLVCGLDEIDIVITDAGITPQSAQMLRQSGVKVIVAAEDP